MHCSVVYFPFQNNRRFFRIPSFNSANVSARFIRTRFHRTFGGLYFIFNITRMVCGDIFQHRPSRGGIALRINPIPDRFIRQSIRSDSLSIDTFIAAVYFYFFRFSASA